MKRTIFCVALTLCAAMLAGCAVQASDRVQSPISAQTELPQMRKADDAEEIVTALLPQMEEKTEDSADAPLPIERANASENADNAAEKQPTAVETAPPTTPWTAGDTRACSGGYTCSRTHAGTCTEASRETGGRTCSYARTYAHAEACRQRGHLLHRGGHSSGQRVRKSAVRRNHRHRYDRG